MWEKLQQALSFTYQKPKKGTNHWCSGGVAYRRGICHYTFDAIYYYTLHSCTDPFSLNNTPPKALFCTTDAPSNMGSNTQGVKRTLKAKLYVCEEPSNVEKKTKPERYRTDEKNSIRETEKA